MHRVRSTPAALLLALAALPAAGTAQTVPPSPHPAAPPTAGPGRRPYRLSPAVDLAVLLSGASLWAGSELMLNEVVPLGRCPCDPARLNDIDRSTAGRTGPDLTLPANVTLGVLLALPALLDGYDVWRGHGRAPEWIEDTLVLGQALVVGGALNAMVKIAVQRPRPSAYGLDPASPRLDDPNTYLSFYSLSAAELFTAAAVGATTYALRHPHGAARWVYLGVAGTLATGFGISRVVLGKHFPTDVIAAAALGSLVGLVVPMLHERPLPLSLGAMVGPGAVSVTATITTP
jgi:membrane-associated phospholipid phosphatase